LYQLYYTTLFTQNPRQVKTHFSLVIILILSALAPSSLAQKNKSKFKKADVIALNDSLTAYSQSDIFEFPNVNKIDYYIDAKAIKKLHDYPQTDAGLYRLTKSYVKQFGVQNFYRNTSLLWELAKLSESFGPKGEALLLYKLLLKHHRAEGELPAIKNAYDSINKKNKKNYVPLSYYYELVAYRKDIDTLMPPQGVLLNMGGMVNSPKAADYGPSIGNSDDLMLFTSKRNVINTGLEQIVNEDLFFSKKQQDRWEYAEPLRKINTQYNEGSACLSQDGKTLIFSRCNAPSGLGNCDLYMASLQKDSTWGNIQHLKALSSTAWDSHPSLSHSGDSLFFASDRLGGFGLSDIYYSVKDKNGLWTKVLNAGPIINSRKSEVSPFFHHKDNVLYFSSDGHPLNFGEFDIYKSIRTPKGWAEPKNTGPLVNGEGSEYYFTIDAASHYLYYARAEQKDNKNLDLFSFPVPMEAQPGAVTILSGVVTDPAGRPVKGIVSIIDINYGVEVAPQYLREDGTYDFDLINKRNYLLIIQGDEFFRIEKSFFLEGDTFIETQTQPVESKISFQKLEFENGKADILPEMHADLDRLGNFLIDHPHFFLNISGHTDSQGKEEANLKLSQARADAIKKYLLDKFKIDDLRITAVGYGSERPLVDEVTDEDRKLNRRVEFEIIRK